tara:strand:- start:16 stop:465 length:450 start_codon:yes stop_codon:yes gene_type:complete
MLNQLKKIKIKKIRVGRGIGSGKGKTSGRGVKGQKSRSGVAIKSFEGGQMPLFRRLPKRGFNPINRNIVGVINLKEIQEHIDSKKLKSNEKINIQLLKKLHMIKNKSNKVKILGNGEIKDKISLEVNFLSNTAKKKLEKSGSSIKILSK